MHRSSIRVYASVGLALLVCLISLIGNAEGVALKHSKLALAIRSSPAQDAALQPVSATEKRTDGEAHGLVQLSSTAQIGTGDAVALTVGTAAAIWRTYLMQAGPPPSLLALQLLSTQMVQPNSALYAARNARITAIVNAGLAPAVRDAQVRAQQLSTAEGVNFLTGLGAGYQCIAGNLAAPSYITNGFTYNLDRCYRAVSVSGNVAIGVGTGASDPSKRYTSLAYFADQNTPRPTNDAVLANNFDAGHIIAASLGGAWANGDIRNFFPQRRTSNNAPGTYYHAEDAAARLRAQSNAVPASVSITITFKYDTEKRGGIKQVIGAVIPTGGTFKITWDTTYHNPALFVGAPALTTAIFAGTVPCANGVATCRETTVNWVN